VSEKVHDAAMAWRVGKLEETVRDLNRKVDRLTWALTLAAVSFASATVMLMVTLLTGAHNP
jgi:hypothetical protein